MARHTQAVAIIGSAPPIKFGFPACARGGPMAIPLPRETAPPVSLADAEEAFVRPKADGATVEPPSAVGAGAGGLSSDSREEAVRPDGSGAEELPLFDRRAGPGDSRATDTVGEPSEQRAYASHSTRYAELARLRLNSPAASATEETIGPAEQIPFAWDEGSSGGRESVDSMVASLLHRPPSTETKAVANPPAAGLDSADTDDDLNSTLGGLSPRDFGGASGARAMSGMEAGE
jgi:hypothetical protein